MGELTGRKVLAIAVGAFSVIIGMNVLMAWQAINTFPGLEVKNSYVASQTFDAERAAQIALGWQLKAEYDPTARAIFLAFTDAQGGPVTVETLDVLVGRTTEARDDTHPVFVHEGSLYAGAIDLNPGKWLLHIKATAPDGTVFRQRIDLFVKG